MQRHSCPTVRWLIALSLGLSTSAPAPLVGQAAAIAGMWRYNAEVSQAPEDRQRAGGPSGGFPGGMGGAPGGGRERGPRNRSGSGSPEGSAQLMGFLRPVLQILIRQDDSSISMSDAGGQMQTVRTDGRKLKEYSLNGEEIETTARWKDYRLSIDRKFGSAGSVKESYYLDPLTKRLVIEVRMSGGMYPRAVEMRRIYDPATGN